MLKSTLLKITPGSVPDPVLIKNIHSWSCSGSCSNQKYSLLVLLRLLLKNANSCRSRLRYSGSCTPLCLILLLNIKQRHKHYEREQRQLNMNMLIMLNIYLHFYSFANGCLPAVEVRKESNYTGMEIYRI